MIKLTDKVDKIPRIGPKYKKKLSKLDIDTVENLIYHFPFRYNDFSTVKKISDVGYNQLVTVKGRFEKVQNIYTKSGKRLTKGEFTDGSGSIQIVWFNMHYIKKTIKIGEEYNLSGKVAGFSNKPAFINPQMEIVKENSLNTGRLVPIYHETKGISSKWLRSRNNDVINRLTNIEEFLPKNLIKKHNLLNINDALKSFHFPNDKEDVNNAKNRFAFEEMFFELLRVENRREAWDKNLKNIKLENKPYLEQIKKVKDSLPFTLSPSQEQAIDDVFNDFTNKHPMNRILEGDVGTGKTVVAVISAYLTHLNGYKTLYMAPTEILAEQHYKTFKEFLGNFNVQISLKTSSSKEFDRDANIIIGTHALIHLEDNIKKVGYIVIDEQHRFGVEQREKLINIGGKKKTPHLLTMTATPIPRSLALTLYGDLSMSILNTPEGRYKNVKTWIVPEKKRKGAYEWIKKKGEQTFIIYPLIEQSDYEHLKHIKAAESEYEKLKNGVFNNVGIGLVHGGMSSKKKQREVEKFAKGDYQILVATPVIEVGIDIPNATIMVIESPERFGLASLHQLRGRVGRKGDKAHCVLFPSRFSGRSLRRLKQLEKHNNGLKLAEIDMKMRGQGDIYGTQQHGFITLKVADPYDSKLLEKAGGAAKQYYPKLDEYPKLKNKLMHKDNALVGKN